MKTLAYQSIRTNTSGMKVPVNDELVTETALAIFLKGEPLTVTMQTPGNEMQLIRGLLFTEGIYKDRLVDPQIEITGTNPQGDISQVDVNIPGGASSVVNKRSLLSVSACGICGKQELEFVSGELPAEQKLDIFMLPMLFEKMAERQDAFKLSGGCHAAASFDRQGNLLSVMEDVGRHNAVDKVIGDLLNAHKLSDAKFLLVSGRVSYEIVAKAFAAGIPLLAAVSAPSTLAVDFARELGITLLGFCRGEKATIYSHPERI